MGSYKATIVRIATRPHPNADRLQLADAGGHTCIIGLDHADGEFGVVFPEGGQLSHEFCMANKLYRKNPETGVEMGGYLDENRRVRALKLRGVESNALWLPLSAVNFWLGHNKTKFVLREELDEVAGKQLCCKYYTPATAKLMRSNNPTERKAVGAARALLQHYSTGQLRSAQLPTQGVAIITEKMHGTSGRTGNVPVEQVQSWLVRLLNWLPLVNIAPKSEFTVVSGTRRCIVDASPTGQGEKAKGFRVMVHNMLAGHLAEGEVCYYEIVGFEDTGTPIMAPQRIEKIGDPKIEKRLKSAVDGDYLVYSYGCDRHGRLPEEEEGFGGWLPRFRIHVYRITANGADVPWEVVKARVGEIVGEMPERHRDFVTVVPTLEENTDMSFAELLERCDLLSRGPSNYAMPLREGVCVRVERVDEDGAFAVSRAAKHKSWLFCCLEGIQKNDPNYVDTEEIA